MQARRGPVHGEETAAALGITKGTYHKLERGQHRPSYDTAVKLAKWLGWTTDQVMEAASQVSKRT